MLDIYGNTIEVGDTVKTKQPDGGLLPPAPAQTGKVEDTVDAFGRATLCIAFGPNFKNRILLEGKINEIILL